MRKVKCFACHKFGHYAGQCPHRKKGGNKTQPEVVASTKTQVDEFCKKFEQTKVLTCFPDFLGHHISWCMVDR
jgi:hypothetical protein